MTSKEIDIFDSKLLLLGFILIHKELQTIYRCNYYKLNLQGDYDQTIHVHSIRNTIEEKKHYVAIYYNPYHDSVEVGERIKDKEDALNTILDLIKVGSK